MARLQNSLCGRRGRVSNCSDSWICFFFFSLEVTLSLCLHNIPELAKRYKVYAVDLLGFGWSEKARIDYDALIWRDQIVDFLKEIVKQPAVLVENSVGGFTTLLAAAALPDQVKGVSLLNSAG
ncbi:hypothetical protein K7X08_019746 [Anisodus acutangulus]|uniref:AB hydrolase-1 domain-containing protein n=1 Tax=Anisodus acutangulus TaxID=402998 RepID=A0A9Q1RMA0_9SOLA|nr:hypothetical protein K7X08_019746 [Anisodus acutangulus]